MPAFRPFPILTLFTLPALCFVLWLGAWQLDRREWKQDLLRAFEATASAPAISLQAGLCEGQADIGRRVQVSDLSPDEAQVRVSGRNSAGAPGWRLFSSHPLPTCAGEGVILLETGFEPLQTATRADDSQVDRSSERNQIRFETPARSGAFTPPSDPAQGRFYAFDHDGMADVLGVDRERLSAVFWLARSDGKPPAYLTQTPPEKHMAYAITWFCMALALLGVYLIFHIRAGRLRWRR